MARQVCARWGVWRNRKRYWKLPTGCQARLNGRKDLVVGWKAVRILLRDALVADPDRELATAAFDQVGLDAGLIPNERRHTDSARAVVSNLAVPNPDVGHRSNPPVIMIRSGGITQQSLI